MQFKIYSQRQCDVTERERVRKTGVEISTPALACEIRSEHICLLLRGICVTDSYFNSLAELLPGLYDICT